MEGDNSDELPSIQTYPYDLVNCTVEWFQI